VAYFKGLIPKPDENINKEIADDGDVYFTTRFAIKQYICEDFIARIDPYMYDVIEEGK